MKLFNIYQNWRRNILPASKNDINWRTLELTAKLIEVDQKLDKLIASHQAAKEKTENSSRGVEHTLQNYSLAVTRIGHMLTFSGDMVIGKSLRETGSFQENDIGKTIHMLEASGYEISRNLFLDVGANIGTHTLYALQYGFKNAVCIEAEPENFRLLRINQLLNELDSRCINICVAASAQSGEVDIELSPNNSGDHRIITDQSYINLHNELTWTKKKIQSKRLDEILQSLKMQASDISFTWIDTQGHEGHVLEGAETLVSAKTPFVAEFWPYGLSRCGGWKRFRHIIDQPDRDIFDLRDSLKRSQLVKVTVNDLDNLFDHMIKRESTRISPHTDLIVVRKH